MKTTKELLLKYIAEKDPRVTSILNWELKDTDDEHGPINEDYIVTCNLVYGQYVGTVFTDVNHEVKCLVNITEFIKWKNKEAAIRWI